MLLSTSTLTLTTPSTHGERPKATSFVSARSACMRVRVRMVMVVLQGVGKEELAFLPPVPLEVWRSCRLCFRLFTPARQGKVEIYLQTVLTAQCDTLRLNMEASITRCVGATGCREPRLNT